MALSACRAFLVPFSCENSGCTLTVIRKTDLTVLESAAPRGDVILWLKCLCTARLIGPAPRAVFTDSFREHYSIARRRFAYPFSAGSRVAFAGPS